MFTKNLLKMPIALIGAVAVLGASSTAGHAATFTESPGDAGELIGTAMLVQDNMNVSFVPTDINGKLSAAKNQNQANDFADLYKIIFPQAGMLTASTTTPAAAGSLNNPQLFLFDSNGKGVFANDDVSSSQKNSLITGMISAGTYYLGISGFHYNPSSSGSLIFPSIPVGINGPTGPGGATALTSWLIDDARNPDVGTYKIDLTYKSVPVPTPALLPGLVALGAGALRKRKQQTAGAIA
jgi:hypothetical protein